MELPARVVAELRGCADREREDAHGGLLMSVVLSAILKKCDYDDGDDAGQAGVAAGFAAGLTARRRVAAAVYDGLQVREKGVIVP